MAHVLVVFFSRWMKERECTYIQWQIETQDIALSKQIVEGPILGADGLLFFWAQPGPVMIQYAHAECSHRLARQRLPDAAHAQDAQDLSLWILTLRRQLVGRALAASPVARAEGVDAGSEAAESAEHEEESRVSGGVVDGGAHIGDADAARRAGLDVDLVVACAVMADETQGGGQSGDEVCVDAAGGGHGLEGPVGHYTAVEGALGALFEEGLAVGGLGTAGVLC